MGVKKEKDDFLLMAFNGEYVVVLTDLVATGVQMTAEGEFHQTAPMIFEGYFVDTDAMYVYLGARPNETNQALKKSCIKHIEIATKQKEQSIGDALLDSIPTDKKGMC